MTVLAVVIAVVSGAGGWIFYREWKSAKEDTVKLIETVLNNAEDKLGYPPDAESIMFLANHPFLSAKVWEVLGAFGKSAFSSGAPGYRKECNKLLKYIRDDRFRRKHPCATALFQYTVYLCDPGPGNSRCKHPKEEMDTSEGPV